MQKCIHCGASKKPNHALIHEIEGSHFDLLTGRDRFSCRGPGTGTNCEKRVNGRRNSVRKFQPGKRAHLFRFSTFSGNFPVRRNDETCSIYRRTENSGNLTKWKAPTVTDWGIEMLFSTIRIMFTIYWIQESLSFLLLLRITPVNSIC